MLRRCLLWSFMNRLLAYLRRRLLRRWLCLCLSLLFCLLLHSVLRFRLLPLRRLLLRRLLLSRLLCGMLRWLVWHRLALLLLLAGLVLLAGLCLLALLAAAGGDLGDGFLGSGKAGGAVVGARTRRGCGGLAGLTRLSRLIGLLVVALRRALGGRAGGSNVGGGRSHDQVGAQDF